MKARGGRFLLVLGAGLAAMAFVVVYIVMSRGMQASQAAAVPATVQMTNIVVASRDVPAFTVLDETHLALKEVELSTVLSGATDDPQSLYGKMTLMPLGKEQQVLNNKSMLSDTGFSNILAKGERAFSLAVTEPNTFGGGIAANDHIDVLWTALLEYDVLKPGGDGAVARETEQYTSTKTLLQDVKVLRVINLRPAVPAQQETQNNRQGASAEPVKPADMYKMGADYTSVLVLAVTDQEAEVLKFARENGLIDLTLRSSAAMKDEEGNVLKNDKGEEVRGDHEEEKTTGITIDELISKYGLLAPSVTP